MTSAATIPRSSAQPFRKAWSSGTRSTVIRTGRCRSAGACSGTSGGTSYRTGVTASGSVPAFSTGGPRPAPARIDPDGLAERGPGGWRRGGAALADVAESIGAAALQPEREREERYRQDREDWRARLRRYQAARHRLVNERDGWWSLDDPDEYDFMACRWPVLTDDVRGPPSAGIGARAATERPVAIAG